MTVPSLQIEVKKDGLRQMQDGTWKLSLTVHPNDMPTALMTAPMGKVYMAVLAAVGDDGEPEPIEEPKKKRWHEMSRAQQAGIRCGEPAFQGWIQQSVGCEYGRNDLDEDDKAAWAVRGYCGVSSRSYLDSDEQAGRLWDALDAEYRQAMGMEAEQR